MNRSERFDESLRRLQLPFSLTSFFSADRSPRVSGIGVMLHIHTGAVKIRLTMFFMCLGD